MENNSKIVTNQINQTELTSETVQTASNQNLPDNLEINIDFISGLMGVVVFLFALGVAWGTLKKSVNNIEKVLEKDFKPDSFICSSC